MSTAGRTGLAISITALPAATPIIRTSSDPVRFTLTAPKALAAGAAAAQSLKHQMAAAKAASKQQAQGADGEGEEEDDDEEEGEGEGEEGEEERQGRAGGQQPSELSGTSPQVAARAGPQPTTPAGGEGKPEEADVAMTSMFSLFLSSNPAAPLPVRVPQDWQEVGKLRACCHSGAPPFVARCCVMLLAAHCRRLLLAQPLSRPMLAMSYCLLLPLAIFPHLHTTCRHSRHNSSYQRNHRPHPNTRRGVLPGLPYCLMLTLWVSPADTRGSCNTSVTTYPNAYSKSPFSTRSLTLSHHVPTPLRPSPPPGH